MTVAEQSDTDKRTDQLLADRQSEVNSSETADFSIVTVDSNGSSNIYGIVIDIVITGLGLVQMNNLC